ncbi:hypothetical protein [Metallibacterium scheffleri]|jgi:hypothetical protein|uniref:hypothetical protein n=1 Tax=Metallibacterium scheffleri TaxID=993689 RepID=UPI0026EDBC52|nr:hypothetical protein [Metallibacterium scheffleri]MBW8074454.1 hypothetical protein [Metallibacterium scheffleri]
MNAYASLARSARMVHALRPWVLYPCMVLLALTAGGVLLLPHGPHVLPFGFIGAVCWALVGSRLLLVQRVLRHSRVPDAGRSVGIALALLAVPTVALPVLVLTITHGLTLASLALLLLCNVAGLLWALAPVLVAIAVPLTPSAVMLVSSLPAPAWLRLSGTMQGPALLLLALALTGYLMWLWRAWLGRDPAEYRMLSVPWVMRQGDQPGFDGLASAVAVRRRLQSRDGRSAEGRRMLPLDCRKPAIVIRCCLGRPYAFVSRRELHTTIAVLLLFGLGSALGGWLLHWSVPGMMLAAGGMAMMLLPLLVTTGMLSLRLKAYPDFLTELALLPGLGSAAEARRHVLHAMLGRGQRRFALMAFSVMLLAFALGAPPTLLMLMLALTVLAFVGNIAAILDTWALRPAPSLLRRTVLPLGWFALIALVVFTGVFVIGGNAGAGSGLNRMIVLVLSIGWALAIPALLTRLVIDWRRFQHRPHPFVQR